MNIRSFSVAILLSMLAGATPASAAPVTYIFTGKGAGNIEGGWDGELNYTINFTIDDGETDHFSESWENDLGGFSNGTAIMTLTRADGTPTLVTGARSTNVNAIKFQKSSGSQTIALVNSSNFYNGAIEGSWNADGPLDTINTISPFRPPLPSKASSSQAPGLTWEFGSNAPNFELTSAETFIVSNGAVAVPEPSMLVACAVGASVVCFRKRKKRLSGCEKSAA